MHAVRQSQRMHQQRRLRLRRWPRSAACMRLPAPAAAPGQRRQLQHKAGSCPRLSSLLPCMILLTTRLCMLHMSACDTYSKMKQCKSQQVIPSNPRLQRQAQCYMCTSHITRTLQHASASAFWRASMRMRSSAPATRAVNASARMAAAAAAASTSAQRALTCQEGNQSVMGQCAELAGSSTRSLAALSIGGVLWYCHVSCACANASRLHVTAQPLRFTDQV